MSLRGGVDTQKYLFSWLLQLDMRNTGQKWIENPFESERMPGTNFISTQSYLQQTIFAFADFYYSSSAVQNFIKQY